MKHSIEGSSSRKGCSKACERCRKSKVRCSADTINEFGRCKRCYQAGAECIFTPVTAQQQRRRRADARIASLEKRLNAVSLALAKKDSLTPYTSDHVRAIRPAIDNGKPGFTNDVSESMQVEDKPDTSTEAHRQPLAGVSTPRIVETIPGYIDSTILPLPQAEELYIIFFSNTINEFPIFAPSDRQDFECLRRTKPILLFAIVTSACRGAYPVLFKKLHRRLQITLVEHAILEGQKSLELIQAILMHEAWFSAPDDPNRLNFYQWISIAGAMAVHIGLIGHSSSNPSLRGDCIHRSTSREQQLQLWRTGLAMCIMASAVSISLHLPASFTVKGNGQHFLKALETSSFTVADQRLVAWAKLQLIAEEIDCIKTNLNITPARVSLRVDIQKLETQFGTWRQSLPAGVIHSSLEIHCQYYRCKLYELAILESGISDGVQTFALAERNDQTGSAYQPPGTITPVLIKAVTSTIQCCHTLLDELCQTPTTVYLHCPTVTSVRALYVINMLSILQKLTNAPQNPISAIVDDEAIMFDVYKTRLMVFLQRILGSDEQHQIACLLRNWMNNIAALTSGTDSLPSQPADSGSNAAHSGSGNDLTEVVIPKIARDERFSRSEPIQDDWHGPRHPLELTNSGSSAIAEYPMKDVLFDGSQSYGTAMTNTANNTDFDLMCMPDLFTGPDFWFGNGVPNLMQFTGLVNSDSFSVDFTSGQWSQ